MPMINCKRCVLVGAAAFSLAGPLLAAGKGALQLSNATEWTVKADVFIEAHPAQYRRNGQGTNARFGREFAVREAAVVFPLNEGTASSVADIKGVRSELKFDQTILDTEPTLLPDYMAGEQIGRWDMPQSKGRSLRLQVEIPMTLHDTKIDESVALKYDWPKEDWPAIAQSALRPQFMVQSDDPAVAELVRTWTKGKPKKVKPYLLAKHLAGRVIEHVQINGQGVYPDRHGRYVGMRINGAVHAATEGQGFDYDMAALLCAVYRNAGLPARLVVGFDIARSLEGSAFVVDPSGECGNPGVDEASAVPIIHPWVEFFLYDEAAQAGEWIPVDVVRQREFGSRPGPLDREWKYFGSHPCLANIAPISFHFHPPTTVASAGPPAMWGWLPSPRIPAAEQVLTFAAWRTVKGGSKRTR